MQKLQHLIVSSLGIITQVGQLHHHSWSQPGVVTTNDKCRVYLEACEREGSASSLSQLKPKMILVIKLIYTSLLLSGYLNMYKESWIHQYVSRILVISTCIQNQYVFKILDTSIYIHNLGYINLYPESW